MMDWFDDDTFWSNFGPLLFDAPRLEAGDHEAEAILDLAHLAPQSNVLDLACGVGRHTVAFARRGHVVTGVDRTAGYLEESARRLESAGVKAELVQEDMRHFSRPRAFDLVLNLYTSFGFFDDDADNLSVLRRCREALRPGGCAVFEMTSKEIIARDFRDRDWRCLADGTVMLEKRELEQHFSVMRCEWTIIAPGQEPRGFAFSHRLYSGSELAALLKETGFDRVQIMGGLDGSPYDQDAERLVAIAWR